MAARTSFSDKINPPSDFKRKEILFRKQYHIKSGKQVAALLRKLDELPDNARMIQYAIIDILKKNGFSVHKEVRANFPGSDRKYRVDILVEEEDGRVVIELDSKSPRRKSVAKLKLFDAYRIIGLRGTKCRAPNGIDEIVGLRVRDNTIP